ncbi:hypothetical protein F1641_16785 [Quadrisphaera sp. INWT6]|nr:hypothetical protein [Quadrisphaera sp. INWT6]MBF5083285.1 hypothetical protein [Quadrisphaera sp. INWT6]
MPWADTAPGTAAASTTTAGASPSWAAAEAASTSCEAATGATGHTSPAAGGAPAAVVTAAVPWATARESRPVVPAPTTPATSVSPRGSATTPPGLRARSRARQLCTAAGASPPSPATRVPVVEGLAVALGASVVVALADPVGVPEDEGEAVAPDPVGSCAERA